MKKYHISIYLDCRREKDNGRFPVKLRVYIPEVRKQKLYPTIFDFTIDEFNSILKTAKPREAHKKTRDKLRALENKAEKVAKKITPFDFKQFETKLYRKPGSGKDAFYHYDEAIKKLVKNHQLNTADTYRLSKKSIMNFTGFTDDGNDSRLDFSEITPNWLKDYEMYMKKLGRSSNTISIYIRVLRTIFNNAIYAKDIKKNSYPFGKSKHKKYEIPSPTKTKRALKKEELLKLYQAEPQTPEQEKAKDYWFFSYCCNGMNMKDICLLTFENLISDTLIFTRAKTAHRKEKEIRIYLTDIPKEIIKKYGNPKKRKSQFIFPIIETHHSPQERQKRIKNFTKFINQNLQKLAIANDLPSDISTMWARHSFATHGANATSNLQFISESLGHADLKTTQTYLSGFEDEIKKDIMEKLMNFG